MKKNNKGFMLTETLVVSALIITVLLTIYTQFKGISRSYSESFLYNTVGSSYNLTTMKKYIEQERYDLLANSLLNNESIDITSCQEDYFSNTSFCEHLIDSLEIKQLLFTKENIRNLKKSNTFDEGLNNFLKTIQYEAVDGYRLIASFKDETYASVRILNGDGFELTISDSSYSTKKIKVDLEDGMIPIKHNGSNWVKADISNLNNDWYDYASQKWANAVLVDSDVKYTYSEAVAGTTIPESDILAYFVWIPRYRYKLFNVNFNGSNFISAKEIEIEFQSKTDTVSHDDYRIDNSISKNGEWFTHPAFWWDKNSNGIREDSEEINGFWVGKFENSPDATSACYSSPSQANCDLTTISPKIKPDVPSWRYQNVPNQFASIQQFASDPKYGIQNTALNSHMIKNMEWGALSYLSRSRYGINSEVYINPSASYITGRGGSSIAQSSTTDTSSVASTTLYAYDGKSCSSKTGYICSGSKHSSYGMSSSTTGNITGVYDISGGAYEYVMGNMAASASLFTSKTLNTTGLSSTSFGTYGTSLPLKYYDIYNYGNSASDYTRGKLGDATRETMKWYSDFDRFFTSSGIWLLRGEAHDRTTSAGLFSVDATTSTSGGANIGRTSRTVLVKE